MLTSVCMCAGCQFEIYVSLWVTLKTKILKIFFREGREGGRERETSMFPPASVPS